MKNTLRSKPRGSSAPSIIVPANKQKTLNSDLIDTGRLKRPGQDNDHAIEEVSDEDNSDIGSIVKKSKGGNKRGKNVLKKAGKSAPGGQSKNAGRANQNDERIETQENLTTSSFQTSVSSDFESADLTDESFEREKGRGNFPTVNGNFALRKTIKYGGNRDLQGTPSYEDSINSKVLNKKFTKKFKRKCTVDSKITRMMTKYRSGIAKTAILGTQELLKMKTMRRKDTIRKTAHKDEQEFSFEKNTTESNEEKEDDASDKRVDKLVKSFIQPRRVMTNNNMLSNLF